MKTIVYSFDRRDMIRAIIVDDEPRCIANLQHYLSLCTNTIKVVATASTIADTRRIISENKFDVAFLDIRIYNENIFSLIEAIDRTDFSIVFVTAYDNFAIRAFKVEALDYLLKPLSKEDVSECCRKIEQKVHNEQYAESATIDTQAGQRKLILRQGDTVFVIKEGDIYYAKAKGFYTEIYFDYYGKQTMVLLSKPISLIEKEYSQNDFFRIHKSYLVNVRKVMHIVKAEVVGVRLKNNEVLPVAKRRIAEFMRFINSIQ